MTKETLMKIACVLLLAGSLSASNIIYNPAPITDTGWHTCGVFYYASLAGDKCRTTAYFQSMSLNQEFKNNPGGISVIFGAAFNAWNTRDNVSYNPPGLQKGWTLNNGGDPGGAFNVTVAQAQQFDQNRNPIVANVITGGVDIQITPNAAQRATLANAVAKLGGDYQITWVQGLYDNFMFNPTRTVPPYYEMDITGPGGVLDPSYCASFPAGCGANNSFSDVPNLRYFPVGQTQAFFYGNAYIAIESIQNKSLTVYDGVDYGWNNYVATPEPGTCILLGAGLSMVMARRRIRGLRRTEVNG